ATIAGALVAVVAGSRPAVFALVGLCGLVSMVSTVAGNALIPMVVAQDELPAANGIHAVGQEAAMALGALAGGLTLAVGGAPAVRNEWRRNGDGNDRRTGWVAVDGRRARGDGLSLLCLCLVRQRRERSPLSDGFRCGERVYGSCDDDGHPPASRCGLPRKGLRSRIGELPQ